MKKMYIYEPAMCCSTGLCGVGVDPELLRLSTVASNLNKNGVVIERFNLTNSPNEFVKNNEVNKLLTNEGTEILPITVVDNKIVLTKAYPTNDEFMSLLNVPRSYLGEEVKSETGTTSKKVTDTASRKATVTTPKKVGGCGCKGGCC